MKKKTFILALLFPIISTIAQEPPIRLTIDATQQIATVSKWFNGSNIEDLNNQTNGALFSQLLHGEAFEEKLIQIFLIFPERIIPKYMYCSMNVVFRI